jgi:hypothetical protein
MAILDTILSTPVDIAALRKDGAARERLLDGAFSNLLWSRTSQSSRRT